MSGIGATGSFQLVESFIPSPAILAGDADAEMEEVAAGAAAADDSDGGYQETYVVRKTKSGRGGIPVTILTKQKRR